MSTTHYSAFPETVHRERQKACRSFNLYIRVYQQSATVWQSPFVIERYATCQLVLLNALPTHRPPLLVSPLMRAAYFCVLGDWISFSSIVGIVEYYLLFHHSIVLIALIILVIITSATAAPLC
jgi:hypothetical protein